jgi:dihydrofolate reductase
MRVSLIVAMARNGVIGRDGGLPWRLAADLQRFKKLTMGHHILMGRKTFESIGRLLPGRISVVITRQSNYQAQGALVAGSLEAALASTAGDPEIFVIGGAEIYQQALASANRIYLTEVEAHVVGDTMFPDWDRDEWRLVERTQYAADERNEFAHTFSIWERLRETSATDETRIKHG